MVTMSEQSKASRTETLPHLNPSTIIESIIKQAISPNQSMDDSSMQGKFGWTLFNNEHIPYILRQGVKFVSLLIMRAKFFDDFQKYFTIEFYMYFDIDLQKMTEAEARLLNEINFSHSDSLFGPVMYKTDDKLISLSDATHLSDFLYFSFEKLIRKRQVITLKKLVPCGFMRINKQNCIPYIWYAYKMYVPLFYIDGECKYLQERAVDITGWPLAYLKLCCKIHGVQKPIYNDNSMTVVDMELVKKYYPTATPFEECWPYESHAESLLVPRHIKNAAGQNTNVEPEYLVKRLHCPEKSVATAPSWVSSSATNKYGWKRRLNQIISYKIHNENKDLAQTWHHEDVRMQNTRQYLNPNLPLDLRLTPTPANNP